MLNENMDVQALNTPSSHVPSSFGDGSNCLSTPTPRDDRVVINVGGTKHETFFSSLRSIPDTRLFWMIEQHGQCPEFDSFKQEYFFDRHPGLFVYILNFYRTGKLHCPSDICGPLFEEELIFWGIDETVVEPCCWMNFKKHREAQVNLNTFEPYEEDVLEESPKVDIEASPGEVCESEVEYTKPLKLRTSQALKNLQQKIWITFEEPNSSLVAQVIGFISMFLIITSVSNFCLETLPYFSQKGSLQSVVLSYIEMICVIWFSFEFIVRSATSPNKWLFVKSPMNWIDLGAILPFFLEITLTTNVKTIVVLRVVRLIRVFRIFKLSRHSCGLQILGHTLRSSCRELFLLFFFLTIGVVIFSSLVFYAEKDVVGTKFYSIPDAFWWSIVTMTTIGYGDVVPISLPGKCVGIMCALCGVLVIALPIPVIVSNFSLYYSHAQAKLRASTRRKRPGLSSAAHALRIARPWGFTTANIKNSKSDLNSEVSETYLNRRSIAPSPTTSIRTNGRENVGRFPITRSINQSPMLSPMNSRTTTFRSLKSNSFPVRQTSFEKASKPCMYSENPIVVKNNLPTDGDNTPSPGSIHKWRLQVSKSPMEYNSPSINISPPSTPSRSPGSHLSYVSTPGAVDKIDQISIFTNDQGELIPPVDSGIATKNTPTVNGTPNSHYLPSSRSVTSRGAESYSSSGTSTSTGLSPRGRTGRRNGIFLAGFATKKWQTKAGIRPKTSDTRSPMNECTTKAQSEGSRQSHSSDSVYAMLDADCNLQQESSNRPSSPGIRNTLNEVSKRLNEFASDGSTSISTLEQRHSLASDDVITANHRHGPDRGSCDSVIPNERLPLWMQNQNRNENINKNNSFKLLDIEGAELFQRRRSKFSNSPTAIAIRKAITNTEQLEFLEGELSPILESNSSGKSSRGDSTRFNQGQSHDGSVGSPVTPLHDIQSSRTQSSCTSLRSASCNANSNNCTLAKIKSAPYLQGDDHEFEVMHRSKSLPEDAVHYNELQGLLHCKSKERLHKRDIKSTENFKLKDCKFQLKTNNYLNNREKSKSCTPLIRVVSDCGFEQIPISPNINSNHNLRNFDEIIETSLIGSCDNNIYPCVNQTRCLVNDYKYKEILSGPFDTSSI